MTEGMLLADAQDRQRAETIWDRNIVVVAGAGTGKTTILVNRILNLLMREPHPLSITEIVALTFTNKAATEMKQRLRRELGKIAECADDSLLSILRNRYAVSTEQLVERASKALSQLEKAHIGTLHSYAAHLLRLHPIEAGVDPSFREDDGSYFREIFRSEWRAWLGQELSGEGRHHDQWRRLLDKTDLEDLRTLAEIMAGESWDLDELERQCKARVLDGEIKEWVETLQATAAKIAAARAGAKQQKAEKMLAAATRCFTLLLSQGPEGMLRLDPDDRQLLERDLGKATVGWADEDFADAKSVISIAQELLAVNQPYFQEMVELLRPFLYAVQKEFLNSGWISFDGLLTRAKNLLRDHPEVRARIKGSCRAILVDEFQDTDPVQYEIILYLAERAGSSKVSWDDVELEAGKLFIVGDPKQSIYAFRRADIEAFERVVRKIIAGGGVACSLVTNFRSDGSVLTVVNELFDRLFRSQAHIQPANERLTARPQRKQEISKAGVHLRVVTAGEDEEEFDAAAATRAEADALARWIKEELLPGTTIVDRERRSGPLQPGHIALIFRKLTQAQEYLDALRHYDVAYLTDGEKHFYRRQEIIDLVNLLRVIDNPHDLIALVGLLRSPLGGLIDQDLLALKNINGLDITDTRFPSDWSHLKSETVGCLYDRLASLHRSAPTIPVPDVIDL
ncbi:UvrD-helicase domain-containing protein, partial [Petrachloros mirabilis]